MVDSSLNIRKLQNILQTIDSERTREGLEIIYLKNAAAESTATTVRQWLSGSNDVKPAGQPATAGGSGSGTVLADQRLNALLVFGNDNVKKAVRELVAKLDVQPPEASSKVNVYYLENTDATEMAKVLDGVVKGLATSNNPVQPGMASPLDSGKITVTPDKASNSLVIMASIADYNNMVQVIKKLDRRSKQVFVQVLIAEVSLDKSRALGVQGGVVAAGALDKYLQAGGLYDPFNTLSSILSNQAITGLIGDKLNNANRPVTAAAVIQALDKNDLVNILSTPNILTSDNKEAEINVGENVPFQGSATQSSIGTTTSVERKDIGINLKIKPQISEGDYIRLDINQEISAVKNDKGQAVDLVTTKRSAKTSIVVKDKETVVIGGLIQDSDDVSVQKVPFLGDIPGLGWLFKTTTKSRKKTNLMILLTPHIVKDASDLAAVSDGQRVKFNESSKKTEPVDVQKEISGK
jgi:general secretion pathway protein D